jgi:integrase
VQPSRETWDARIASWLLELERRPGRKPSDRLRRQVDGDLRVLQRCLGSFATMPSDDRDAERLEPETALEWLVGEGYGVVARTRLLTRWGQFLGWRTDADKASRKRGESETPRFFVAAELTRLVTAAWHPPAHFTGAWPARDAAVVGLLTGTGAHPGELVALSVPLSDVREMSEVSLGFRPSARRTVPVPREVAEVVTTYLDEREQVASGDGLFRVRDGRPLSLSVLGRLVDRLYKTSGVAAPESFRFRPFRTTFAVRALQAGWSVEQLRGALGEPPARAVQQYLRAAETDDAGDITAALVAVGR